MAKVSIQSLIEAGAHFGHQTRRWNPKMEPYIFGSRGDIYIIDLKQTLQGLDRAYTFVRELTKKGGIILFVGTKKQAQETIADSANRCGMPYVNARWLGGMMTNFVTIRDRVRRMEELEAMQADGRMDLLPKKEQILLGKELAKLQVNLNGIRNLRRAPDAVFIIDTNREEIALREARRLDIPVVGTLDTNCDPDDVEYGIPANDDAIRSVQLLCDFIADAVIAGVGAPVTLEEMTGATEAAPSAPAAEATEAAPAEPAKEAVAEKAAAKKAEKVEKAEEDTEAKKAEKPAKSTSKAKTASTATKAKTSTTKAKASTTKTKASTTKAKSTASKAKKTK